MEEIKRKIYFKFFNEIEKKISDGSLKDSVYEINGEKYRILDSEFNIQKVE